MPFPQNLWVITTRNVAPRESVQAAMKEHLDHQVALEKSNVLFGAGPLYDDDGKYLQAGMVIIRAADRERAMQIADSDPMHRKGLRHYTLQQWAMREGRITVSLDVSDLSGTIS